MTFSVIIGIIVTIVVIVVLILVLVLVFKKKKSAPTSHIPSISYQTYNTYPMFGSDEREGGNMYAFQWSNNVLTLNLVTPSEDIININQDTLARFNGTQKFLFSNGASLVYPNPGSIGNPVTFSTSNQGRYFNVVYSPDLLPSVAISFSKKAQPNINVFNATEWFTYSEIGVNP